MEKTNEETITITKKLYNRLKRDSRVLLALDAGGVDNWEGYEESLSGCDVEVSDS